MHNISLQFICQKLAYILIYCIHHILLSLNLWRCI